MKASVGDNLVQQMAKKGVRILEYILMAALAVVFVYFALRGIDWKIFADNLHTVRWGFVLLAILASLFAILIRVGRWRALLLPFDSSIKWTAVWDASNLGNLSYLVVPGSGEFVRCGFVTTRKATYDKVLGTTVMERVWDLVMAIVVLALAIILKQDAILEFIRNSILKPASGRFGTLALIIVCVLVVLLAGFIYLSFKLRDKSRFWGKIAGWIVGMFDGFKVFGRVRHKGLFIFQSAVIWFFYVSMCQCVFCALPGMSHLTFADALFISAAGNLAAVVPVPGGIGAYHYIVALALSQIYGFSWEAGILFATLAHEGRTLLLILLGAVSSISVSVRKVEKDKKGEAEGGRDSSLHSE